jgi:hypothetical protein
MTLTRSRMAPSAATTSRKPALGVLAATLLGLVPHFAAAQAAAGDTVSWSVSTPAEAGKSGGRLAVTVHGAVQEGWHVYALKQLPEGPTPLAVSLDSNSVAKSAGPVIGSVPEKVLDPGFGVVTPFYAHDFTITVPVQLASHLPASRQLIPINVRFQTCNGQTCKPPKTVTLSAPINIAAR